MSINLKWINKLRSEDPRRIRQFKEDTCRLAWDDEHLAESLSKLFQAVDNLAEAEVDYYYCRRGTRAWISGLARFGAWIFGSIGLLLPQKSFLPDKRFVKSVRSLYRAPIAEKE